MWTKLLLSAMSTGLFCISLFGQTPPAPDQITLPDGPGKCIVTGEAVDRRVVVAKSY